MRTTALAFRREADRPAPQNLTNEWAHFLAEGAARVAPMILRRGLFNAVRLTRKIVGVAQQSSSTRHYQQGESVGVAPGATAGLSSSAACGRTPTSAKCPGLCPYAADV